MGRKKKGKKFGIFGPVLYRPIDSLARRVVGGYASSKKRSKKGKGKITRFRCSLCGLQSDSRGQLRIHQDKSHPCLAEESEVRRLPAKETEKQRICKRCGNTVLNEIRVIKRHVRRCCPDHDFDEGFQLCFSTRRPGTGEQTPEAKGQVK